MSDAWICVWLGLWTTYFLAALMCFVYLLMYHAARAVWRLIPRHKHEWQRYFEAATESSWDTPHQWVRTWRECQSCGAVQPLSNVLMRLRPHAETLGEYLSTERLREECGSIEPFDAVMNAEGGFTSTADEKVVVPPMNYWKFSE